jgi:archaellum component FlaC
MKPSERIGRYEVPHPEGYKLYLPDCDDVRREMDEIHERLERLEKENQDRIGEYRLVMNYLEPCTPEPKQEPECELIWCEHIKQIERGKSSSIQGFYWGYFKSSNAYPQNICEEWMQCPICGMTRPTQEAPTEKRESLAEAYQAQAEDSATALIKLHEQIAEQGAELIQLRFDKQNLQSQLERAEKLDGDNATMVRTVEAMIDSDKARIKELEGDIVAVRLNSEVYEKRCAEYIDRIVGLEKKIKDFVSEINNLGGQLNRANTKISSLKAAFKILEDK